MSTARLMLEPRAAELAAQFGLAAPQLRRLRQLARVAMSSQPPRAGRVPEGEPGVPTSSSRITRQCPPHAVLTQLQTSRCDPYVGIRSLNVRSVHTPPTCRSRRPSRSATVPARATVGDGPALCERLISDALLTLPELSQVNLPAVAQGT